MHKIHQYRLIVYIITLHTRSFRFSIDEIPIFWIFHNFFWRKKLIKFHFLLKNTKNYTNIIYYYILIRSVQRLCYLNDMCHLAFAYILFSICANSGNAQIDNHFYWCWRWSAEEKSQFIPIHSAVAHMEMGFLGYMPLPNGLIELLYALGKIYILMEWRGKF